MNAAVPFAECRVCSKPFVRLNSLQAVCGVSCARKVPIIARKQAKQDERTRREKLKTRGDWQREAQSAFNAWIRARDEGLPCICCGAAMDWNSSKPGGAIDAGHYMGTGASPELRFDEANVHAQRKSCNRPGGARRGDFRAGMISRVGIGEVERLEGPQSALKPTADELRGIRDTYRAKLRELIKGRE